MAKSNLEKIKEILNKYGCDPPPEDLFEINESIKSLVELIKKFEREQNNGIKTKKHG